ncbi:unnamed protein product [Chilo suppressalis]|uniref:Oligomycin sensitivity conferral protein n=1 Tax=Chilo suppressalis TaxID=168631 RepID=A0ABN8AVQ1_CHISP|nr:unnamed protein product [Chilo suppressalis]
MFVKHLVLFVSVLRVNNCIYPYFDTQDFIYNVPKVFRISITLDKLLEYYEKKPSKDPEWYIALGVARGQLEYTINKLDKSVPVKLKENLMNITRRMDRIRNNTDYSTLVYRSKDYEYVAKAIFENMEVMASSMEPITVGTMGTQKPYRFNFEQYVQEARTKMPTRKAADACTMQLLISAMEIQTTQNEGTCEMTPECNTQLMQGSGLAFQQTSRVRAAVLAKLFDCMEGTDLSAHIYKLCIQIYKETKSLESWDHPAGTRTLFMQQIFFCASQGYGEFIKPRWMNKIISWQEPKGCYADDRQPFLKLTGYVGVAASPPQKEREEEYRVKKAATSEGGTCNSLTSAMALGSMVIYVRALLETDQAFQYDVLLSESSAQSIKPPIPIFGLEGRYVSALYSAALQMKQMDDVEKHLRALQKELLKPTVVDFIETSMISSNDKAKLMREVGQQAGMPSAAINFLGLVAENGRLKKLRRMINMLLTVMVAHRNEALCEVITAKPLDDGDKSALMDALQKFVKDGKKIQLTEKIDPSIIGGMIVGVEDKHIDMSIARKIQMYTDILKQSL